MAELTPMMQQYYAVKERNPDCLLFFRLGDFYEMFDDDARLAARELDLTLTTRDRNVEDPAERTPMCGVPYHSAEAYIGRLIAKGYKVAICEQMEDPALAKGFEVITLLAAFSLFTKIIVSSAYLVKCKFLASNSLSSKFSIMFDNNGDNGPPCGVPIVVSS